MNKFLIAGLTALTFSAQAANYASLEVDVVKDTKTRATSTAQYFRAGTNAYGLNLDVTSRTAAYRNGGLLSSYEGTVGKQIGPVNVFGGLGYDNGFNGAKKGNFTYGLVGASAGMPIGPVYAFAGAKTRVNWDSSNPKQTVAFAGVSYNLTKSLSVDLDVSRSTQTINEKAAGVGLRVAF
jgi:hypothetical protein